MNKIINKYLIPIVMILVLLFNSSWIIGTKSAKVKDFVLCHKETTIKGSYQYLSLNKLTDDQLKSACTNPSDGNYVTTKLGTLDLRDGNTRIYILKQRGFAEFVIPYDEIDTGSVCDF